MLDKNKLVQFKQKILDYRKNVILFDVYKLKVIHNQNDRKSTKTYLYTDLCTLSTAFLCKLRGIIMVT